MSFVSIVLYVAPHVGAWIETYLFVLGYEILHVAPHVGAWIETNLLTFFKMACCRAPRGRVD